VSPIPPVAPIVSASENKIKKTLKLFKDSWNSISKAQKFQLIAVFTLVLGLPLVLGGVYATKIFRSGAATPPISPPISPPPTSFICKTVVKTFSISLTPNSQSSLAGGSLLYNIAVKNLNMGCPKTEFSLSTISASGWTAMLSNSILTLDQGETGTAQVTFTSSKSAKPGSYPVSVGARNSFETVYADSAYKVLPGSTASCGITCQPSAGCSGGLTCYQPPMPPCPVGKACVQVMPAAICRNPSCLNQTNCVCGTPAPTPRLTARPTPTTPPKPSPTPPTIAKPTPTSTPIPIVRPTPTSTPRPAAVCQFKFLGICLIYRST